MPLLPIAASTPTTHPRILHELTASHPFYSAVDVPVEVGGGPSLPILGNIPVDLQTTP